VDNVLIIVDKQLLWLSKVVLFWNLNQAVVYM